MLLAELESGRRRHFYLKFALGCSEAPRRAAPEGSAAPGLVRFLRARQSRALLQRTVAKLTLTMCATAAPFLSSSVWVKAGMLAPC